MQHQPTISVVIPAFNAAGFVGRAIESAIAQTYQPLEILVVNDGSQDDTRAVVSSYSAPVRLLCQPNGGPAAARNHGVREALGEWIALLDADDTWLPNKLERQLRYTGDPRVGIIHCLRQGQSPTAAHAKAINFDDLWERNRIANSSVLVRRTALEQVGGFDEDRALISVEDYNLWLRLAAAKWQIALCPEPLWRYTPAPGNLSSQVERFVNAELVNLDKIARTLAIDPRRVQERRVAIYDRYGRDSMSRRQMRMARKALGAAMLAKPTPARLARWLSAFIPAALLDLRRSVGHTYQRTPNQS